MSDPIVESVRAKLAERSSVGIKKYGTTMARTDLSHVDWLRHAQEELLDGAVYLERLIQDAEHPRQDWRGRTMSNDNKPLSERVRIMPLTQNTGPFHGLEWFNRVADEIAALEQRLAAAEAEKQAAIDAALSDLEDALNAEGRYDSADLVRSRIDTNPLAEAQAHIAELTAQLEAARKEAKPAGSIWRGQLIARVDLPHGTKLYTHPSVDKKTAAQAERYKFLRGDVPEYSVRWLRWEVRMWDGRCWDTLVLDSLDAAIDAAMNAKEPT